MLYSGGYLHLELFVHLSSEPIAEVNDHQGSRSQQKDQHQGPEQARKDCAHDRCGANGVTTALLFVQTQFATESAFQFVLVVGYELHRMYITSS